MSNTQVATCSIQNVISAAVDGYVQQFNQFSRKTAEAIIGMADTVFKAKNELSPQQTSKKGEVDQFKQFCEQIRYHHKSSSIRKLYQIGEMADMLRRHADQLPNTWTTIYTLTQLGQEQLERLITEQKVVASLTAKQACELLETYNPSSDASVGDRQAKSSKSEQPEPAVDEGYMLTIRLAAAPGLPQAVDFDEKVRALVKSLFSDASITRSDLLDALLIQDSANELKMAA